MSIPFSPSGFGIDPGGASFSASDSADNDAFLLERAVRTAVIGTVFVMLLGASLANIIVLCCRLNDVINFYLISLSVADLLFALLIVPFSLFSSLKPGWNFAGDNSVLCKCSVYVHVVLLSATVFTFAWISVDRYAAFMKPSRYEVAHTATRCKCWILFSWITSLLIACPILITKMESKYSPELELCLLNWTSTLAYSVTLGVLVLVPSLCTVLFTSTAIIAAINKPDEVLEDLQRTILDNDQNFAISLFILISFLLSWLPIIVLQLLPASLLGEADISPMRFAFSWLAVGGGSSKLLIYSFTSKEFRRSLCCCCIALLPPSSSFLHASNTAQHSPVDRKLKDHQRKENEERIEISTSSNHSKMLLRRQQTLIKDHHHHQSSSTLTDHKASTVSSGERAVVDYGSFGLRNPSTIVGGGEKHRQRERKVIIGGAGGEGRHGKEKENHHFNRG